MSDIRPLTPDELKELQGIHNAIASERFKLFEVKGNTAIVPRGQEIANELEAIVQLLDNAKTGWIASKLAECGVKEGQQAMLDIRDGTISIV